MSISDDFTTITSCVDAITRKYNDAAEIIQRVKAARADKQAPAPSRYLEETIQCAPEDVAKEQDRGLGRFGLAFQQGDETSLKALRGVSEELDGFIGRLQHMAECEDLTGAKSLVDQVDGSRDNAIDALIKLRQRCLATETEQTQSRKSSDASTIASQTDVPSPPAHLETAKTYHFPQHHNPWLKKHGRSHTLSRIDAKETSDAEDTQSGAENHYQHRKHGHGSILHFLKHHRAHSHDSKGNDSGSDNGLKKIVRTATSPLISSNSTSPASPDTMQSCWPNSDREGSYHQRQSSEMAHRDSIASVDTVVGVSPTSRSYRSRAASNATSIMRNSSLAVPTPTEDNDFLGFCKGAVRLQNGDKKALERRKEANDGWTQTTVYYLACSSNKCVFAGHLDTNIIMTKVFVVDAKGLQFRWPFLAKSHVLQSKAKDNTFSYQCLFCVFTGERAATYHGTDAYVDHVSTHRGDIGDVILYKARCINNRVADQSEEFDINLYPMYPGNIRSRRASTLTEDMMSLHMSPSMTKNDSVMSAVDEPWNEGLSDFHYKDDLVSGEMG